MYNVSLIEFFLLVNDVEELFEDSLTEKMQIFFTL